MRESSGARHTAQEESTEEKAPSRCEHSHAFGQVLCDFKLALVTFQKPNVAAGNFVTSTGVIIKTQTHMIVEQYGCLHLPSVHGHGEPQPYGLSFSIEHIWFVASQVAKW